MLEDYASLCEEYSNNQISHQQQQVIDFSPFEEDPSEINQHVRKEIWTGKGWNNETVFRSLCDFILLTSFSGLEKIKNEN